MVIEHQFVGVALGIICVYACVCARTPVCVCVCARICMCKSYM